MAIQSVTASTVVTPPSNASRGQQHTQATPRPVPEPAVVAIPAEQLERMVEEVRRAVEPVARNLQFSLDDTTGKTIVRVVDASTNEVIRQIPSEEVLAIARALDRLQGLLIEKEA